MIYLMKTFVLLFSVLLSGSLLAAADESQPPPPLSAENVNHLESVLTRDFDSLPGDLVINSGWFVLSPAGTWAAFAWADRGVVIIDTDPDNQSSSVLTYEFKGEDEDAPMTLLEADFSTDGSLLAGLHTDTRYYYIAIYTLQGDTPLRVLPLELPDERDRPVRIWLSESELESDDESGEDAETMIWLEVLAADANHYVMRLPIPDADAGAFDFDDAYILPSGPEADREAFVRIGRIPAPLAITSTTDGLVKLWNLETGEVTAEVTLDGVPVFGRVNETTGQQLAWRDPESETLQLLDFGTGDNREIAPLDGAYIQAFALSPGADIVLGVAVGDDPVVAYWDVETGAYEVLGEYRECSRVPDMVRLSEDGTTLVIGCDTGLDVWRVGAAGR